MIFLVSFFHAFLKLFPSLSPSAFRQQLRACFPPGLVTDCTGRILRVVDLCRLVLREGPGLGRGVTVRQSLSCAR